MPDLNQIKQGEQGRATGAGGSPRVSPAILPSGPATPPTEPLGLSSCCSRSRPATSTGDCSLSRPATRVPQPACTARPRGTSTNRRDFAADSPRMLRRRSPKQSVIAQPDGCGSSRTAVRSPAPGWNVERSALPSRHHGLDPVIQVLSALTNTASSAWMPTDQVRGLKAHGSSLAMTALGWVDIRSRSAEIASKPKPDTRGSSPATTVLSTLDVRQIKKYMSALR